jgi:hypothetical protein
MALIILKCNKIEIAVTSQLYINRQYIFNSEFQAGSQTLRHKEKSLIFLKDHIRINLSEAPYPKKCAKKDRIGETALHFLPFCVSYQ